jgi:hypothetical protein
MTDSRDGTVVTCGDADAGADPEGRHVPSCRLNSATSAVRRVVSGALVSMRGLPSGEVR